MDLVDELECDLQPFCAVAGLRFQECDERHGPWRNYYVGVVGDVDSDEDDVLWPNQASMQASAPAGCCPKCAWSHYERERESLRRASQQG